MHRLILVYRKIYFVFSYLLLRVFGEVYLNRPLEKKTGAMMVVGLGALYEQDILLSISLEVYISLIMFW